MNNKNKAISGLLWRLFERCGAQGVSFVVSIILARLLEPEVYGTLALVTVFTTIMQVFVDAGLGNALIQKKETDEVDFSTVFYFNIVFCTVLYLILFIATPFISAFYGRHELTALLRVQSIVIIISALKNIQQAYVSRNLLFKKFFYSTLSGTIGAAIIGILMAYMGFGIWALVVQSVFNTLIDTIVLWFTVRWRPVWKFSVKKLKELLSFGWKLLFSTLLDTTFSNIRQLLIGKFYSSSELSFYNRGKSLPNMISINVNSAIDSVLFPVMSQVQDEKESLHSMAKRAIQVSTFLMFPLMMGMFGCADQLIEVLLTKKWMKCVPYLRIFCITNGFYIIHSTNLNVTKSVGKMNVYIRIEIIKKLVTLFTICIAIRRGPLTLAVFGMVESFIHQFINAFPSRKIMDYGYFSQIHDIIPQIIASCIMASVVYAIGQINISPIYLLIIQVPSGAFIYIILSALMKNESLLYVKKTLSLLKVRNNKVR